MFSPTDALCRVAGRNGKKKEASRERERPELFLRSLTLPARQKTTLPVRPENQFALGGSARLAFASVAARTTDASAADSDAGVR